MTEESKNSSVVVYGDNSGIIITGNNNTINIDREKLLGKESVTNTFKSYYQNYFKTISLLIEDDKKHIEDIYVNLAIIKEEKEEDIRDKSKLLDRDKIINSYEEIYKPKESIAIEELIEKSSKYNSAKALIYGKAGIGKTTFCKYISYRWAKGELYNEFDNIVYIALREWEEGGLESIIKKIYFQEKYKDYVIEINQSKTLFLFDGYDELVDTSILHNAIKTYNLQNYIITSRPYGYRKSDFDVNEVFEIIGFTDENVTAYIDKFFEEQSHKTNLQNFLQQNINIEHIAYMPLMLEMICSLWREKAKSNQSFLSPMTMTELYGEVIEYIFFEYSETNNTAYIQDREDEIFDYLGKIAFEGLKRQVIVLDKSIIKEKKKFFVDYVLKTGFLKSDRKHRNPLMNSYEFPHLTFQEYFSALYVSKLPKEEISEVVRDYKFYPHMQVFFIFLSGLIDDKEFLLGEIESEPRDLVGFYIFELSLICVAEFKKVSENVKNKIYKLFIYWLIFIIKHKLDYEIILDKLKFFVYLVNEDFFNILLKIIRNKKLDKYIRIEVSDKIVLLSLNDNKFIENIIKIIKDEKEEVYTRAILAHSLSINQNDILNINLDWLDDYTWDEFYMKHDIDIFDYLEEYMDNLLEKMGKASDFLDKAFEDEITEKDLIEYYITMDELTNLFSKYNQNNKFLEIIIRHSFYNLKLLALKEDRFYSIENGQEIQTERKVTLEEIEEVKRKIWII